MDNTAAKSEYSHISLWRWFAAFIVAFALCACWLAWMIKSQQLQFGSWGEFKTAVPAASPALKMLVLGLYLSICCTFLPLNTSWIISAAAMQSTAVADSMWQTVLLVSLIGAAASTVANLNDYHLFTFMMRHHHISKIRHTKTYAVAIKWFERSPFILLLLFNVMPIPIDVVRPLAATHKYPRMKFALANFLGRFVRYAVIAAVTYMLGKQGWVATVALLGMAILLALPKLAGKFLTKRTTESQELQNEAAI